MTEESVQIDGINYGLNDIEKDCWVRIFNGSLRSKDVLHSPTIANVNEHGVNMRVVVLRKVWVSEKKLAFHTDVRSGKWDELQQNNKISWLFYDAPGRFQIRVAGTTTLHTDDEIANEAWLKSYPSSRKVYMGEVGPSSISDIPTSGLPQAFEKADPTIEESEAGRKNFGVVITTVDWMEWLWLNSKGHKRASFNYLPNNEFEANWLIP